jgi:phospholipid/cholesterol/gamma-HCH transport system substrate-binding protein
MNRGLLIRLGIFFVIAGLLGAMEVGTLTGPHVGTTHSYHAIFGGPDGVSALRVGNPVKVSGVAVGKVTSVKLLDAEHARVTFTANEDQTLTTNTWAIVRYANLLGQRFLALTQAGDGAGTPLKAGATIPQNQTQPALSLTALFNGFRPLFAALTPQQVNDISNDLIKILQGQTSTIDDLVVKTADLTKNLAARDDTFNQVMDSLSNLLTTVSKHDNQLAGIVTSLHSLTTQLHADGPAILDSLDSVDGLMGSVSSLFAGLQDHNLPGDITDLNSVTGVVSKNSAELDKLINNFVLAFGDFARITQNGNWANIYPCNVFVVTRGTASVTTADALNSLSQTLGGGLNGLLATLGVGTQALAALAAPIPLTIPNGQYGSNASHSAVCS